jgi:hypothetical protein
MAWTIYSVGDGKFLEQILNGVAMIAGTGELSTLAGIGMLVGLIMLGLKSILNGGQGIQFQVFLVNYIIFMAIFGGKVTVVIDDVYNNKQHVVANVPQGVGIAGSIVSQIGLRSTELFEQGFSYVAMTDQGFASALKALSTLRQMTMTKAGIGTVNAMGSNGDLWRSWTNYIKDCTLVGVDLKQYTIDDIKKNKRFPNGSSMEQLRYDSNSYGTEIYLGPVPEVGGCAQMYGKLAAKTPVVAQNNGILMDQLKGKLALDSAADASNQVEQALFAVGQSGVQAQQYMITTLLEPIFNWATIENEFSAQKAAAATMLHSSIQQRNAQWAAEQALFQTTVRPMMTFFEGLIYAITPIMAFLVGLGPMGFSLIGKYLMIMMWIQLWMPTLAIVNLYMNMSLSRSFNAMTSGAAGVELTSFYGMQAADQELQSWIATGGMLAAAVPGITLMLVYGSAVTATSLAGRMASGAADVDNMSPSVLKNGPVHENSSQTSYNPTSGHHTTGAERIKDELKMGSQFGSALSSMNSNVQSQSQQLSSGMQNSLVRSGMTSSQIARQVSSRLSEMGGESEAVQANSQMTASLSQGVSSGLQNNSQFMNAISAHQSMGFGMGKFIQANGSLTSEGKALFGSSKTWDNNDGKQLLNNASRSTSHAAQFSKAVAKDQANSNTANFITSDLFQDSETLSKQASKLHQSSQQYQQAATMQQSVGTNWSMNSPEAHNKLLSNPELRQELSDYMRDFGSQGGLGAMAESKANYFDQQPYIKAQGTGGLMGAMYAIASGDYLQNVQDPAIRDQMTLGASNIMAMMSGSGAGGYSNPFEHQGIGRVDASAADAAGALDINNTPKEGILAAGGALTGVVNTGINNADPRGTAETASDEVNKTATENFDGLIATDAVNTDQNFPVQAQAINSKLDMAQNNRGKNAFLGDQKESTLGTLWSLMKGDNNMQRGMGGDDGVKGNYKDFAALSPEEQKAEYDNAYANMYDYFSQRMTPGDAAYAAAEHTPMAVGYMYSGDLEGGTSHFLPGFKDGRADLVTEQVSGMNFHHQNLEQTGREAVGDRTLSASNQDLYLETLANVGSAHLAGVGNDGTAQAAGAAYEHLKSISTTFVQKN